MVNFEYLVYYVQKKSKYLRFRSIASLQFRLSICFSIFPYLTSSYTAEHVLEENQRKNVDDVEKINKSIEIYKTILPLDLYTMLFQSEWNIIELESMSDIMTFLEDFFPKSQTSVEKEMYIFYALYNEQGQLILSNE